MTLLACGDETAPFFLAAIAWVGVVTVSLGLVFASWLLGRARAP